MIEIIGNTPLEIVILLSAKTFALSAEFEVNKLPAAHKINQAAKIIWDRNTRETVKPPVGLRKSECVFSLASPWIHWSFHELSNETITFKQTMFNQCFLVKQWCLLFQRTFSALTFSVLLASKTAVTLIPPSPRKCLLNFVQKLSISYVSSRQSLVLVTDFSSENMQWHSSVVRDGVDEVSALGNAGLADAFVGPCVVLPFVYCAIGLHSYIWKYHCNWCCPPSDQVQVHNLSLSLLHSSSNSGN